MLGAPLPPIRRASFRFIADPAAQVAALLSGDIDAFPRVAAARSLKSELGLSPQDRLNVAVEGDLAPTVHENARVVESIAKLVQQGNDVHYVAFSACETVQPDGVPADRLRHVAANQHRRRRR